MMGKELSIILAILVVAFAPAAASKSCSDRKGCKKCLGNDTGCAWHVGPDFTGCIDADQCDSEEYGGGECFTGEGDYACGISCSTQSDSTCEGCLTYDIFGNNKKKSDCAWFVRNDSEPRCIYHKQCTDRGFEAGKCIQGKKNKDNIKKCRAQTVPQDECEQNKKCTDCFGPDPWKGFGKCAWYVDGKVTKCINEKRCDVDEGFETGTCFKGSEIFDKTFDKKKVCKRIKKNKPIFPPDDTAVGIEKCSDFSGLCTDCLNSGCFWVNLNKQCVDSCEDAPQDIGCRGTTPPSDNLSNSNRDRDRALLSFEDEASYMCYNFARQDINYNLCKEASTGGCETCVNTLLFTDPGLEYLGDALTCRYFPDSGACAPDCGQMGCGVSTCKLPTKPIEPPWDEHAEWPELLGQDFKVATDFLERTYGKDAFNIVVAVEGSFVTMDYRLDRVRLWVDKETEKIIVRIPMTG